MNTGLRYVDLAKAVNFEVENVEAATTEHARTDGSASVEYEYINGFSKGVTIVDREGLQLSIPPSTNPRVRDFIVRVRLRIGQHVNVNVQQLLNSTSTSSRVMGEVIQQGVAHYQYGECRYTLDYTVTQADIEGKGGSLYLNNLDRVISTLNGHLIPQHPYSEVAIRNRLVEENDSINNVDSFGYSLRIVDSLGNFGERYVNINKQVYKVPVTRDCSMPDGVYLSSSGPVDGDYNLAKPVSKRYSFEEADTELRLYKTVDAARTFGDELAEKEKQLKEFSLTLKEKEQRLKEEKMQREYEFEQRKQEIERQRTEEESARKFEEHRLNQRQAALKEEIAELEHKRNAEQTRLKEEIARLEHRRTLEMIQHKDGYEHRSLERKESGEMIKFLPAFATGVLACVVAFTKFGS